LRENGEHRGSGDVDRRCVRVAVGIVPDRH
jgi:hypothetical protein